MRRPRIFRRGPDLPIPLPPDSYAPSQMGAFLPQKELLTDGVESQQGFFAPQRFDNQIIVAAPASGTTIFLVGDANTASAPVAGGQQAIRVPHGSYAAVTGIFPYLEGGAGAVQGPRIPGAGVSIIWRLLVDNVPDGAFGNISTILAPWNSQENRPLVYVRSGRQLTCSLEFTDPAGLYSFVGIRLMGWLVPFEKETRVGVASA